MHVVRARDAWLGIERGSTSGNRAFAADAPSAERRLSRLVLDEKFSCWVGEYSSILKAASREGWLLPLLAAHWTPCDQDDARRLLAWIRVNAIEGGLPHDLDLRWRNKRGKARFNRRTQQYGISLPSTPGTNYAQLRVGLVLHEAAHVIDRRQTGRFGHRETFRRILRRLVEDDWRKYNVRTGSVREIYGRHRGPYSLLLGRSVVGKGGRVEDVSDRLVGPYNAEEAHEKARALVGDPKDNVADVHVFSISEGQFTGAFYTRGKTYESWAVLRERDLTEAGYDDMKETTDGRMELPQPAGDEPTAGTAALLSVDAEQPAGDEPVRPDDALRDTGHAPKAIPRSRPVRNVPPQSQAAAGAKRKGVVLEFDPGNAERWPTSKGASIVRTALEGGLTGTASELAKALAADLTAAGVEFPASLISRLKQGGFLREHKDNE